MKDEHTTSDHPLPRGPGDTDPDISGTSAREGARSREVSWPRTGHRTSSSSLQRRLVEAGGRPVRLGRYEVTHVIGAGGMGKVYAARNLERDERVALKTLLSMSSRGLYRFKQEFRNLAGIHHPNLVALHELGLEGGEWFFTMDHVEGVSFSVYTQGGGDWTARAPYLGRTFSLEDKPWPAPRVTEMDSGAASEPPRSAGPLPRAPFHEGRLRAALAELATGVAALHAMSKVHRDLNPGNVLVTPEGRVVVLDFGLICDGRRPESPMLGMASGTPSYMSPEQFEGKATPAGDWYSVGVMLFEALTGRLPFFGTNTQRMRTAKLRLEAPRASSLVAGVPEDLDDLCAALLRRRADERPDAAAVLRRTGAPAARRSRPAPRLLGRRAEIGALSEALGAARAGEVAVALVHGPNGAGKTALCERFVEGAAANGALVLRGAASARERIPHRAIDPVVDAVAMHLAALRDDATALVPPEARELARIFPVLAEVPAVAAIPETDEAPRDPGAVAMRALAEILRRMAGRGPVVVWIDDVEHAGPLDAVIDALTAPGPSERRPLLLLSGACDPRAVGARRARIIHVGALLEDDAAELAGAEATVDGPFAAEIARAAGGLPRLVVDLAAFAAAAPGGEVSIDAMFEARAAGLSDAALRLLEVLAAAHVPIPQGIAFDLAALAGVASAVELELAGAGMARATGPSATDTIEIDAAARGVMARRLSGLGRRRMHMDLADALGRWPGADPEIVARHLADAGLVEEAADRAGLAADHASSVGQHDRAAALLSRALAWTKQPAKKQALAEARAEALADAGRPSDAARAFLGAAAGVPGHHALDLRRRAAELLLVSGRVEEGLALQKPVLDQHGLRWPETPRDAVFPLVTRLVKLRIRGVEIPAWAERTAPPAARAQIEAAWSAGKGLALIDPIRSAVLVVDALLSALTEGDVALSARGIAFVGCLHAYSGVASDELRGNEMIEEGSRLARRTGDRYLLGFTRCCSAISRICAGLFREAMARMSEGFAMMPPRGAGLVWERHLRRALEAYALLALGALAERAKHAERTLAEARERGDRLGEVEASLGTAFARLVEGQPGSARATAAQALDRFYAQSFTVQHSTALWIEVASMLYEGAAAGAWARLEQAATPLGRSHIMRIQLLRIDHLLLRGVAAASLAAADRSRAAELLPIAEASATSLARERRAHALAAASVVRAAAVRARAPHDGDGRAVTHLLAAAGSYDAAEMKIHAACARRAAGVLSGGADGRSMATRAAAVMRREGVADPARFTRMHTGVMG